MPIDEFTRTGETNGTRRRPRSRRGMARDDDRPRGFEPDRMRRLWDDIDRSRDNLGLGPEPAMSTPSWSVAGIVGQAAELATTAIGTALGVLAAPTRLLAAPAILLAAPARALGEAVPCVRRLPLVGGLFGE